MPLSRSCRRGFSLLELLAAIIIISIVAGIVLPRISVPAVNAKRAMCKQHRVEINRALESYFVNEGTVLDSTLPLDSPAYFPDGIPRCPVNNTQYIVSATSHRIVKCSCEE